MSRRNGLSKASIIGLALAGLVACQTADVEAPAPLGPDLFAGVTPLPSAVLDASAPITRFAVGSCNRPSDDQSIWNTVRAAEPELFLYVGDNVYGDVRSGEEDLPELREAYADLAASEPFAALRAETPVWAVWDDHDYGLNDAGGDWPLKWNSEKLFDYVWAIPETAPSRRRPGIYDSKIVGPEGQRVQFIMLDTRFFRSPLLATDERDAPGKERYLPDPDPAKTMLGDAQWAWLEDELSKPADLRFIVSSIQVIAEGHGFEAWRTLPSERERLYDLIDRTGAGGVVFLSGDRHAGGLYLRQAAVPYDLPELTSSSLNLPLSAWLSDPSSHSEASVYRRGDMFIDANFGLVEIDWGARFVDLQIRDDANTTVRSLKVNIDDLYFTK